MDTSFPFFLYFLLINMIYIVSRVYIGYIDKPKYSDCDIMGHMFIFSVWSGIFSSVIIVIIMSSNNDTLSDIIISVIYTSNCVFILHELITNYHSLFHLIFTNLINTNINVAGLYYGLYVIPYICTFLITSLFVMLIEISTIDILINYNNINLYRLEKSNLDFLLQSQYNIKYKFFK